MFGVFEQHFDGDCNRTIERFVGYATTQTVAQAYVDACKAAIQQQKADREWFTAAVAQWEAENLKPVEYHFRNLPAGAPEHPPLPRTFGNSRDSTKTKDQREAIRAQNRAEQERYSTETAEWKGRMNSLIDIANQPKRAWEDQRKFFISGLLLAKGWTKEPDPIYSWEECEFEIRPIPDLGRAEALAA